MSRDRDGRALANFITGSVLAGGNAVGVRVSNRELDPFCGAGLRFLLAACLLGAATAVLRLPLPRGRVLSAWIDDEPIGAGLVVGGAMVLAGVYVGALRHFEPAR